MSYFQHLFTLIFCSFNDMILHDPPLESLSRHSSELRLGSGTKKTLGQGQENIVIWIEIPVLDATKTAGDGDLFLKIYRVMLTNAYT